jgi:beta-N-acetylhexosaminidase
LLHWIASATRRFLPATALALQFASAGSWGSYAWAAGTTGSRAGTPAAAIALSGPIEVPNSLVKLLGQRIMVSMRGKTPAPGLLQAIRAGQVGSVIIYKANIASLGQLRSLTRTLQSAAQRGGNPPLLIAIDQEGGGVKRLPGPPTLSPAQMAGTGRVTVARQQGIATGKYLKGLGITLNIAPILDVPTSTNSFMYRENRTFSFNANVVARFATAFALGQQSAGVASAAALFPGLGPATIDTDIDPGERLYPTAAQRAAALKPYQMLIPRGLDAIVISNAVYPAYDRSDTIADLSAPVMRGLLRDRLGFKGVVITDAMVRTGINPVTSGVRAAEGGADIMVYSADYVGVLRALEAAYQDGRLSRANAVASYQRIVALKDRVGS